MSDPTIKEIQMDVHHEGGGGTRKRRGVGGRKRKTRVAADSDTTVVSKDHTPVASPAPAPAGAKPVVAPKIVLAPPKPKLPKVLLVPKGKVVAPRPLRKTFKAKHLKVTIDNSAKTQKRRSTMLAKVDEMTDDQIRAAAVHARLSRRETVANAPIDLLRQMVKDYQIMKERLL